MPNETATQYKYNFNYDLYDEVYTDFYALDNYSPMDSEREEALYVIKEAIRLLSIYVHPHIATSSSRITSRNVAGFIEENNELLLANITTKTNVIQASKMICDSMIKDGYVKLTLHPANMTIESRLLVALTGLLPMFSYVDTLSLNRGGYIFVDSDNSIEVYSQTTLPALTNHLSYDENGKTLYNYFDLYDLGKVCGEPVFYSFDVNVLYGFQRLSYDSKSNVKSRIKQFNIINPDFALQVQTYFEDILNYRTLASYEGGVWNCQRCGNTVEQTRRELVPGMLQGQPSTPIVFRQYFARDVNYHITRIHLGHDDWRAEEWCIDCFSNNSEFCDRCDAYYSDEEGHTHESHPSDYCREVSGFTSKSEPDKCFTSRFVGVEIEIEETDTDFVEKFCGTPSFTRWGVTTDGSLGNMGLEFISNKMSGESIGKHITKFYKLANDFDIETENRNAGLHMNVDMSDIYSYLGAFSLHARDKEVNNDIVGFQYYKGQRILDDSDGGDMYSLCDTNKLKPVIYSEVPETLLIEMGHSIVGLCRRMVSRNRAHSEFCDSPFGYRDKHDEDKPHFLPKSRFYSYPAIALRDNRIEFRVFPSTSNVDNVLARLELSQKLIDFISKEITSKPFEFWDRAVINRETNPNIYLLNDITVDLSISSRGRREEAIDNLAKLISLSEFCTDALKRIHQKFYGSFNYNNNDINNGGN